MPDAADTTFAPLNPAHWDDPPGIVGGALDELAKRAGCVFSAYASTGGVAVTTVAATLALDTVRLNGDSNLFSHSAGEVTVAAERVMMTGARVTVGIEGNPLDSAYQIMAYLKVNGVEVAASRAHGGSQ